MKNNFIVSSSNLRKILDFNLKIILLLGNFTYQYLNNNMVDVHCGVAIKPDGTSILGNNLIGNVKLKHQSSGKYTTTDGTYTDYNQNVKDATVLVCKFLK